MTKFMGTTKEVTHHMKRIDLDNQAKEIEDLELDFTPLPDFSEFGSEPYEPDPWDEIYDKEVGAETVPVREDWKPYEEAKEEMRDKILREVTPLYYWPHHSTGNPLCPCCGNVTAKCYEFFVRHPKFSKHSCSYRCQDKDCRYTFFYSPDMPRYMLVATMLNELNDAKIHKWFTTIYNSRGMRSLYPRDWDTVIG